VVPIDYGLYTATRYLHDRIFSMYASHFPPFEEIYFGRFASLSRIGGKTVEEDGVGEQ